MKQRLQSHPALPSIASRLGRALLLWALVWGAAVGVAVWLAAASEVDELLDEGLMSSVALLAALVTTAGDGRDVSALLAAPVTMPTNGTPKDYAWQVVDSSGRLLLRSPLAPTEAWHAAPQAGFSNQATWRLYGVALPVGDGPARMLYAAQARAERSEVRAEVGLSAALSALAVGLLGQFWLRARVRAELQPLQSLSDRLEQLDIDTGPADPAQARLGTPERRELVPVHAAVDGLMARLSTRISNERAFSAHAAHALRTPLAGIDAQLALALRDANSVTPASASLTVPMPARLQRIRDAAARLQSVVAALLGLFRTGTELDRVPVNLPELLARLPTASLHVSTAPSPFGVSVLADADLLAAAVMNLLDNSQRHGASHVQVSLTAAQTVRVQDDGPGVDAATRQRLQQALDAQDYEGHTGLGLMLADRVARAHGGSVVLPEVTTGFVVELKL